MDGFAVRAIHPRPERRGFSRLLVNRGMAFLINVLLNSTLQKSLAEVKKDHDALSKKYIDALYWFNVMKKVANEVEIYTIFRRPDFYKFLENSIRFMINVEYDTVKISKYQSQVDPELAILFIQRRIHSLIKIGTGWCYDYASYALQHLLKSGIGPGGSVIVFDKESSASGHNFLVIGIDNPSDYTNLSTRNALIFDYWTGGIHSTLDAFSSDGPLERFDESRILLLLHTNKDESNPFKEYQSDTQIIDTLHEYPSLINCTTFFNYH